MKQLVISLLIILPTLSFLSSITGCEQKDPPTRASVVAVHLPNSGRWDTVRVEYQGTLRLYDGDLWDGNNHQLVKGVDIFSTLSSSPVDRKESKTDSLIKTNYNLNHYDSKDTTKP